MRPAHNAGEQEDYSNSTSCIIKDLNVLLHELVELELLLSMLLYVARLEEDALYRMGL